MLGFWITLVVCIAGLLIYVISKDGRVQAIGKDCFWVGLLVLLLEWVNHIPGK